MRSLNKISKITGDCEQVVPLRLTHDFSSVSSKNKEDETAEQRRMTAEQQREEEFFRIIDEANHKANEIVKNAEREAVEVRNHAEEEGYLAGFKCGREEGRKQAEAEGTMLWEQKIKSVEQDVTKFLEDSSKVKDEMLDKYLDDLRDITMAVAQKVINVSMKSSGEVIKRMIVSATDKIKKRQWAKIYISKADARFLVQADSVFLKSLNRISEDVKIVPVDNGESGTCIIELPDEIIDASINTQMDNIKNIIQNS